MRFQTFLGDKKMLSRKYFTRGADRIIIQAGRLPAQSGPYGDHLHSQVTLVFPETTSAVFSIAVSLASQYCVSLPSWVKTLST
jgi:hypothetical protein